MTELTRTRAPHFVDRINEPIRLQNTPNLAHEIMYEYLNKKILLKLLYKNRGVKSDAFSKRNSLKKCYEN